jgi:hypothetical protein
MRPFQQPDYDAPPPNVAADPNPLLPTGLIRNVTAIAGFATDGSSHNALQASVEKEI